MGFWEWEWGGVGGGPSCQGPPWVEGPTAVRGQWLGGAPTRWGSSLVQELGPYSVWAQSLESRAWVRS